jgi:hypothetical protein
LGMVWLGLQFLCASFNLAFCLLSVASSDFLPGSKMTQAVSATTPIVQTEYLFSFIVKLKNHYSSLIRLT